MNQIVANHGGSVAQWLALSPHSKKVLFDSWVGAEPFWWNLHVLLVPAWVFSGCSVSPTIKKKTCMLALILLSVPLTKALV
ncbi:hypothetical protein LDENG_00025780 [Lucifuga dentata]|nr:hypothetical protein LDENG_00025780 [Lucifuga dentata]